MSKEDLILAKLERIEKAFGLNDAPRPVTKSERIRIQANQFKLHTIKKITHGSSNRKTKGL